MNFTLRSASSSFNQENERLTRKRPTTTSTTTTTALNRFLSFNENKSSSAENRRRSFQSTPNLIELLEEDEDDTDDNQALCHECNTCTKVFASEYGLNHHINMHHPNQSILCSICNITFRSHRSLKTHQQRRHSTVQTKGNANASALPNYSSVSSYLVLAFSSQQFPIMAKSACEKQRLPLGSFSSKLYQCHLCLTSFPCSRTLKYHFLDQHEQYEYETCQTLLSDLIERVEFNLRTVENNEMKIIEFELAQQASQFGLINKQLATRFRSDKKEQNHLIYPVCQHEERTCANLCLQYLSSYSKLMKNYPYAIPTIPKGNPFTQGSIISTNNPAHATNSSSTGETNGSNELTNGRQKRKSIKQIDSSSSPRLKRRMPASIPTTDVKPNRTSSNHTKVVEKQQSEQKTNDTKVLSTEQTTSSMPKKVLPKDSYIRSSSISSNSSTSTRSSMTKSSSSATNLPSQRTSKRSRSPSIITSAEKRRRAREQKRTNPSSSSANVIRIDDEDDIEQENDDDDDNNDDAADDDDVVPIKYESTKQRQASSGSIEYVQTLNNDQQLNNIENIKSKSKVNDEEIIICRSPPSVKKVLPSSNKTPSKSNGARKSNVQQALNNDEHVRVRCKICGEILEGRSRFSKHVISMHSHLLKKNLTDSKQQQHQTAIVR